MRKILVFCLALVCMAIYACGGTDTQVSGPPLQPDLNPPIQTSEVIIESVLARVVPANVTALRFTATDAAGNRVFGPEVRQKAGRIVLVVPVTAKNIQIEYLEGDTVVGIYEQALDLVAGGTTVINDPAFVDVTVVSLQSIVVNPSNSVAQVGASPTFTATGNFSNGTSQQLSGVAWTSDNAAVASIDPSSGVANALGAGTANISATFQGVTGSTSFTVQSAPPVPPAGPVATSLVFTQQPVNGQATLTMAPVAVQVRDQNNQPFAGTVSVTLSLIVPQGVNPNETLQGTTTVDSVNGTATFDNITTSGSNLGFAGFMLQASATGLPNATSLAFNMRPAPGTTIGNFTIPTANTQPSGIVTGPDGALWFAQANPPVGFPGTIGRIATDGTITELSNGLSGNIQSLGITSRQTDNTLYFTQRIPGRLGTMSTAGVGSEPLDLNGLLPAGITTGPDDNIWLVLSSNTGEAVVRYAPPPIDNTQFFSTNLPADPTLIDITSGPDGNLWFTALSLNSILRIQPDGTIDPAFSAGAGSPPTTICSGPDGQLWFCRDLPSVAGTPDGIGRMDTAGNVTGSFALPNDSDPQDICVGPDGNLWVTLRSFDGTSAIPGLLRITPAGVQTTFQLPLAAGPTGITAGPDGNLWISGTVSNNILQVVP